MDDRIARTSEGTIAWVVDGTAEAERSAAQLRAAGFADVRLSERSGTTAEAHVPADEGLTATDFASTLEAAGFERADARALTHAIERGGVLVTLAAGEHADTALAVLRGEPVRGRAVGPVDALGAASVATPASSSPPVVSNTPPDVVASPVVASPVVAAPAGAASPASAPERDPSIDVAGVVALREEQLEISKTRAVGEARVRKEVVTEQRTITVPVRREELVIERDGEADVRVPLGGDSQPASAD